MSIDTRPETKPLHVVAPPSWGDVVPAGVTALAVRIVLVDRIVTYPASRISRWEHVITTPEELILSVARETVVVEGRDLFEIRAALDQGRLCEVRVNHPLKSGTRPGPQVRRISIAEADPG